MIEEDRALGIVKMYFCRRIASNDIYHDPLCHYVNSRDLDLVPYFGLDPLRSVCIYVSTRLDERKKIMAFQFSPTSSVEKLFAKNLLVNTGYFDL